MAEFLVYKGPHWMDKLHPLELAERMKDPYFAHEYISRYRPGDIVKVYSDGKCTEPVAPNVGMKIVKVPGMSMRDAKGLSDSGRLEIDNSIQDKNGKPKLFPTSHSRYSIDLTDAGDALTRGEFDQRLTDKESIQ